MFLQCVFIYAMKICVCEVYCGRENLESTGTVACESSLVLILRHKSSGRKLLGAVISCANCVQFYKCFQTSTSPSLHFETDFVVACPQKCV